VEEFDAGGGSYQAVQVIVVRATGQEEEEGAQPLAAGADEVEDEGGDHREVDLGHLLDPGLYPFQIESHRGEDVAGPDFHHHHPEPSRRGARDVVCQIAAHPRRRWQYPFRP
jgi:hypothetical protein